MKHHLISLIRVSDDKTTSKDTLKVPQKKLQLQEQLCANVVVFCLASCLSLFALHGSSKAKNAKIEKGSL